MKKIAIMGAGAYGTALGQILTENNYEVSYYDPFLNDTSLDKVLDGAEMILLAVPSVGVQNSLSELPRNLPMIVATKGILSEKIFDDFGDVMVLSGPGFASDIKAHKDTLLTASDKRIIEMFGTNYLKFDFSNDIKGILMCGALKNAYAILAGILDLKAGTEEHEKFLSEVAEEMKEVLEFNGAKGETVELSCGKGDLRLTCNEPSRNYGFGKKVRLDPNYHTDETVEGIVVLQKIRDGAIKIPNSAKYLHDLIRRSKTWS